MEIQAFGTSAGGEELQWLVPDHLGTPRIILDHTGNRTNVKRHDYLPFGEELYAGTGGRTVAQGYAGDGIRQQFTQKERDVETGLDYFGARYYRNLLGRFTSVDPLIASGRTSLPQSWNRYAYTLNNPVRFIDPDGLMDTDKDEEQKRQTQQQQQPQPPPTPPAPAQPASTPQTPTGLTIKVVQEANTMRNYSFGGSLFTGVGALLELTPTDQNGQPIPNVTVIESVTPSDTIQNSNPVTSPTGTVTDLVGTGERHPASQPKTLDQAGDVIVPRLNTPRTINQTHQMAMFSPSSGIMGLATHTRTLTNVAANGNLVSNVRGNRIVNNYRITNISPATVIQNPW